VGWLLGLGRWVVAGTGTHEELAVVGGFGIDVDGAVAALGGGLSGVVADGVLVADIAGYLGGDVVDVGEGMGEEGEAAGFVGKQSEGASGAVGFLALVLVAEEKADGVDYRAAQVLDAPDGLFEVEGRGIVLAVGDDEEHFFGKACAVRELIG